MTDSRPTDAPAVIGSLVAALGGIELRKLLESEGGDPAHALVGREFFLDARHHTQTLMTLRRNPECRFDHRVWEIESAGDLSVGAALELGGDGRGARLGLAGEVFAPALDCAGCRQCRPSWKLRGRLTAADLCCPRCSEAGQAPHGFGVTEWLAAASLPAPPLDAGLRELGFQPRDIITLRTGGGERHFEFAPDGVPDSASTRLRPVVLAGCGNIGSALAPHLARLALDLPLGPVVLVDPDRYEERNLRSQEIRRCDLGRPKVEVQAERIRGIHPGLEVVSFVDRIENVPRGRLQGAVVLGALDSRGARLRINEAAWRVGSPWIDMAVDGPGLLCRVGSYVPGEAQVCFECELDEADYEEPDGARPCDRPPEIEDERAARA